MSATGAAIQLRRVRPPWAAVVTVVLVVGILGSLAVQVSERNVQPAPEVASGVTLPTTAFATESGAARTEIYRELGRLSSLRVESPFRSETGLMKAQTALYARSPSSEVAQRFPTLEGRAIRMDLGRDRGLSYYFVGGGLPIVVEKQLIGAIGVGGGNMDEMCAYTALTKVLGPQPPLPAPAARGGGAGAPAEGGAGRGGAGGGGRGGRGQQ